METKFTAEAKRLLEDYFNSGILLMTEADSQALLIQTVAAALQAAAEQSARLPLIAAAPDMLEALKEISIFWSEPYTEGDGLQRHITIELIRRRLDAAIAKAEGK